MKPAELAQTFANEALETLADLMRHGPPAVRVRAAMALLDRAEGRPGQAVTVEAGKGEGLADFLARAFPEEADAAPEAS
jgi:hypothetical protein